MIYNQRLAKKKVSGIIHSIVKQCYNKKHLLFGLKARKRLEHLIFMGLFVRSIQVCHFNANFFSKLFFILILMKPQKGW